MKPTQQELVVKVIIFSFEVLAHFVFNKLSLETHGRNQPGTEFSAKISSEDWSFNKSEVTLKRIIDPGGHCSPLVTTHYFGHLVTKYKM